MSAHDMPCRFCGAETDGLSNSCAECRRMKGRLSDKSFLHQVWRIASHQHEKDKRQNVVSIHKQQ